MRAAAVMTSTTQLPFMSINGDDELASSSSGSSTWMASSSAAAGKSAGYGSRYQPTMMMGGGGPYGVGGVGVGGGGGGGGGGGVYGGYCYFDNEPPLLDELGINVFQISKKLKAVMVPFAPLDVKLMADGDLSGPFFIGFLLGLFQLLVGKLHFGVILGWTVVASLAMYILFNLLLSSKEDGGILDLYVCASIVGYCLCPLLLLGALCLMIPKGGGVGLFFGVITVLWSTRLCSNLLVGLVPQASPYRFLVAYPCVLIYSAFTLLVLF